MSKTEIKKIVKKYAQKLKKEKYPLSAIYLYGSWATGKANKFSDIDVAVISERLKRNWNYNEEILWQYTLEIDDRIEPIGLTKKDFENKNDPLIQQIKKTGIKIV